MSSPHADGSIKTLVVTGLSGAGKTTVLNALEDIGFYCIDNLPPSLIASTLQELRQDNVRLIAFGLDIRARAGLASIPKILKELGETESCELSIIYLDASEELLVRRFSATRRPHPLSTVGKLGQGALLEGLARERELLAPLREQANLVMDTTHQNVHELRREVLRRQNTSSLGQGLKPIVRIQSFGFKFGPPQDADLLFDIRFLPNPFFVTKLRHLSGLDPEVSQYVLAQPDAQEFLNHLLPLIQFCIPKYQQEGKSYITIGIGCTGGRHRSVAITEEVLKRLKSSEPLDVSSLHRDASRGEHRDSFGTELSPSLQKHAEN